MPADEFITVLAICAMLAGLLILKYMLFGVVFYYIWRQHIRPVVEPRTVNYKPFEASTFIIFWIVLIPYHMLRFLYYRTHMDSGIRKMFVKILGDSPR